MATYTYTIGVDSMAREMSEGPLHTEILAALPAKGFTGILIDAGMLMVDIDTLSAPDKTTRDNAVMNHDPDLSVQEHRGVSDAIFKIDGGLIYSTTGDPFIKVTP